MTPDTKTKIKSISIESYLTHHGHQPQNATGGKVYFNSPFRTDSTPSFMVNTDSNTYYDFADSQKPEDIISLAQRLHGLSFSEACNHLANWNGTTDTETKPRSFFSNGQTKPDGKPQSQSELEITSVGDLKHFGLLKYACTERGIAREVALHYLKEIHFCNHGQKGYGVAMSNDSGGFNVRSPRFKFKHGKDGITTIAGYDCQTVNVFEGQFDFLAACTFFGLIQPRNYCLILNSTNNAKSVLNDLKTAKNVNLFLDNDTTGRKTVEMFKDFGIKIIDCAPKYYPNHKDFNEMLISQKTVKN
jgi:Toprim-like/CHC2 zinc finger